MVDGSGLENRRRETFRGFESRPLRFNKILGRPKTVVNPALIWFFCPAPDRQKAAEKSVSSMVDRCFAILQPSVDQLVTRPENAPQVF